MQIINYFSIIAIPATILIIVVYGLVEKNKVFDNFLDGAKEGVQIVFNLFPTLLGLFLAVGALRASGILDLLVKLLAPIIALLRIPFEIMPLIILRPISGSAATAMAVDMMKLYGPDSVNGQIISTIMGSTETLLYVIVIYTAAVGIKKTRHVIVTALVGDIIGMVVASLICRFLS
ncbi:MAG: spore maturation protein [Oscillospiraceae bacterium]|nr:spore maturation protein [Oscillospiraceae bacterium]